MRISRIAWDAGTIAHIARHGVEPGEVEDVCFKGTPHVLKTRRNRYIALGQTSSGRYLTIIFEPRGEEMVFIVTARAMSDAERRIYKRR